MLERKHSQGALPEHRLQTLLSHRLPASFPLDFVKQPSDKLQSRQMKNSRLNFHGQVVQLPLQAQKTSLNEKDLASEAPRNRYVENTSLKDSYYFKSEMLQNDSTNHLTNSLLKQQKSSSTYFNSHHSGVSHSLFPTNVPIIVNAPGFLNPTTTSRQFNPSVFTQFQQSPHFIVLSSQSKQKNITNKSSFINLPSPENKGKNPQLIISPDNQNMSTRKNTKNSQSTSSFNDNRHVQLNDYRNFLRETNYSQQPPQEIRRIKKQNLLGDFTSSRTTLQASHQQSFAHLSFPSFEGKNLLLANSLFTDQNVVKQTRDVKTLINSIPFNQTALKTFSTNKAWKLKSSNNKQKETSVAQSQPKQNSAQEIVKPSKSTDQVFQDHDLFLPSLNSIPPIIPKNNLNEFSFSSQLFLKNIRKRGKINSLDNGVQTFRDPTQLLKQSSYVNSKCESPKYNQNKYLNKSQLKAEAKQDLEPWAYVPSLEHVDPFVAQESEDDTHSNMFYLS